MVVKFFSIVAILASLGMPRAASAEQGSGPSATVTIDGSPAPVAPETITRDERGRATVRAIKLTEPLRMDGKLDEQVYELNQPFGGFLQVAPKYGAQSTERSDVWISYDDNNIYVSCRCWDSLPPDKWIANELRRDTNQLRQNDHFGVMFDTFYDRRSGFLFYTNTLGALADYSVIDEGGSNSDWNPVWESRTGRFDGGWTVEMAIPFKTLRYRSGSEQMWGLQLRRAIRHKNEWTYLTPVPQNLAGPQAFNRISAGGTLVGLDLPPAGRNLELKPYAIARTTTDRLRVPNVSNDFAGDIGGDVKYGVTANLTADFTVNTDFAQVEIDEQQVNLTRFSLFFPEKREFFLEGRGVFDFARGGAGAQGGGFGGGSDGAADTPYLFYSRRIGLNGGRVIPITAGGRLTGKVGPFGVGVMNIQAGDETLSRTPDTNFTVVRIKRDILRRSTIGAMFTNRSDGVLRPGSNQGYGVDGQFSFYQNVSLGAYYARTATTGLSRDDDSYQAKFDYSADRYGARLDYLKVGDNFNPEVGFLRRDNFNRSFAQLRFSPRPKSMKRVRKFSYQGDLEYVQNRNGFLETRQQSGRFDVEFDNSDRFVVTANRNYEFLDAPFRVATGVIIPVGGYGFHDATVSYSFGQQRRISGNLSLTRGQFYDGDITSVGYSQGRISLTKRFSLEPSLSLSRVELPYGEFTTKVVRSRVDYGFSPRMFASALVQYNSTDRTFSSNLRYRWEYRPGSEVFLVWTDEQDTRDRRLGGLGLRNRALVLKATRLLRF
ncbi:MAG TPA: DUF5916 domain-containing protein [Vicinamibacterales bacterium]|nr:DUF5916 domain-containing protein [Vicinamibacterales bacterium]